MRWSLAETLADAGLSAIQACDGPSALYALQEHAAAVDLVLLAFQLPDSNDLGLLAEVRRAAPHACVILMTTYGRPELTAEAVALGAWGVLDKPFDITVITQVARALSSTRTFPHAAEN